MDLNPIPKWQRITGWVLTALPAFALLSSSVNVYLMTEQVAEGFRKNEFPEAVGPAIGVLAFVSAVLYCVPRTAVLGAILMTAYLGGAVATHVRVRDGGFWLAVIIGVMVWLGLYFRDRRVRALLPLRS